VYLGQLALNLLWYVLFFDAKKPRAAQLENVGGCATVLKASLAAVDTEVSSKQ
jgi:tryptophan-rich sensory protein